MELKIMCREVRQKLKLSQREFARFVGTNQTEISFIERGFIPESREKIAIIKYLYNNHFKGEKQ